MLRRRTSENQTKAALGTKPRLSHNSIIFPPFLPFFPPYQDEDGGGVDEDGGGDDGDGGSDDEGFEHKIGL